MADLILTSLTDLDVDAVQAKKAVHNTSVQERNPEIDTRRGVLADLVGEPNAALGVLWETNIDRVRRSNSLQAIEEDPTLAEDGIVDKLVSNYFTTRMPGELASGKVTIVVDKLLTVTVPSGLVFTANGQTFVTEAAYVARTSNALLQGNNDRVLNPLSDGNYSFEIDVVATAEGAASALKKDTLLTPAQEPVNFVKSYATSDFSGGLSEETNGELVARLQLGLAAKAMSNRTNMLASLLAQDGFEHIVSSSIIGYGDAEMMRDQRSIFPISMGGRVDWYLRPTQKSSLQAFTKTATLVEKKANNRGIWQFSVDKEDLPGFYDVYSILPEGETGLAGSYEVTSDVRGLDLSVDGFTPDIATATEGAYSSYQAASIQFEDSDTSVADLSVGATKSYAVTLRGVPLIAEIQEYCNLRDVRPYGNDILVKAPVPCFISLSMTLELEEGAETPDLDGIKTDLAETINTLGFTGRLPAARLTKIVHSYLDGKSSLGAITMLGKLRYPSGETLTLLSKELLSVPNEPVSLVSPRTTVFFCDPEDIAIATTEIEE